MTELIDELRLLTDTGATDYTLGQTTYWSDDHLQQALDRRRADWKFVELPYAEGYSGGAVVVTDYLLGHRWIERDVDVLDLSGNAYGTALYTIDYDRGRVVFTASTGGSSVYVNAQVYDLNRAAADVWRQKAGHLAKRYDVSTDNQRLTRSQLLKQALEMAQMYEGLAGPTTVLVSRGDE
jgi:sirohydrochlorin ferrochelatase